MSRELPDYANITSEALASGCRAAMEECDARVAELIGIPAGQRTFGNTVLAVEEARAAMREARAAWCLLAHAYPDLELREAAREWGDRLDKHKIGIDLDERVHRAVSEYAAGEQAAALTGTDARLLGDLLRDYRRSGIELPAAERERIRVLRDELVGLASAFHATLAGWSDGVVVERGELDGLPESYIDGLERVGSGYPQSMMPVSIARRAARPWQCPDAHPAAYRWIAALIMGWRRTAYWGSALSASPIYSGGGAV